ncbi:transporter substrate-binding domain-containing protein [Halotalea alkalilenta]|uniref:Nickel transporter n=1 Tax=Halotalea alkalilenta TaxID=376489 RepID=A0A172YCV2_9GAMM|nr:transporter substrate-binding domain-containing protein [Halotalea alkalilenta]ANF57068.1 nickel transporter [Halotalea alkalilenta]
MKRIVTAALFGASLTLAVGAHAQGRDYQSIRIGVDVPYEPMEYRNPDGSLTGFDIELGDALCERAELQCEWVVQAWDGIIPGLLSRRFDAIMSSMTINEERRQQVLFSEPYISPPSAWFAPSSEGFTSADAQTLKGKTIGVQRGTLQDNYVTDLYGSEAQIRRYATADDLVIDMSAGRIDIAFLDFPIGKTTMLDADQGDYVVVGDMIDEPKEYFGDGFGIAFRPRDEALAERFNQALAEVREDGTYQSLYDKYFGVEE